METTICTQKTYDHRLKALVRSTQDITCAVRHGVPRSTARGWLRAPVNEVISIEVVQLDVAALQEEVIRLQSRVQKLIALLRVVLAVLKLSGYSLNHERVPDGEQKRKLLRAIDRSRPNLPLRSVLRGQTAYSSRASTCCRCLPPTNEPNRGPFHADARELAHKTPECRDR